MFFYNRRVPNLLKYPSGNFFPGLCVAHWLTLGDIGWIASLDRVWSKCCPWQWEVGVPTLTGLHYSALVACLLTPLYTIAGHAYCSTLSCYRKIEISQNECSESWRVTYWGTVLHTIELLVHIAGDVGSSGICTVAMWIGLSLHLHLKCKIEPWVYHYP